MSLKRKSENIVRLSIKISVYLLLVVCMVLLANRGYSFGKAIFSNKGYEKMPGTDITVTIYDSDSKMDVAGKLADKGIVGDKLVFYVQSLLYEGDFIPGVYTLNTSLSGEDIVETLSTPVEEDTTEGK